MYIYIYTDIYVYTCTYPPTLLASSVLDITMPPYINISTYQSTCQYINISIYQFINIQLYQYINIINIYKHITYIHIHISIYKYINI